MLGISLVAAQLAASQEGLLSTLFSNTLSLCFSLNFRDHAAHPYGTTGEITVSYILTDISIGK
jgi:hypothetical protein